MSIGKANWKAVLTFLIHSGRKILSFFGWLYFARVPLLGLLAMVGLPLAAQGPGRTLCMGAFDLHTMTGSICVGVLLPLSAWVIFLCAAIIFGHGGKRTRMDLLDPPDWVLASLRIALWAAIAINLWTIVGCSSEVRLPQGGRYSVDAAGYVPPETDPAWWWIVVPLRPMCSLAFGFVLGLAVVFSAERFHWKHWPSYLGRRLYFLFRPGPVDLAEPGDGQEDEDWLFRGYAVKDGEGKMRAAPGHLLAIVADAVAIFFYGIFFFLMRPDTELTALVYLLLLLIVIVLSLAGLTFFLDAFRIPVLIVLALVLMLMANFPQTDHFYRVWPQEAPLAEEPGKEGPASDPFEPLTPAEVLTEAGRSGHPVVLVACAGGGIQATAWTVQALTGMDKAALEAKTAQDFAASIQCISGVSGGSSGAMFFVNGYGRGLPAPRKAISGIPPTFSQVRQRRQLLKQLLVEAEKTSLGQSVWGLAYPDLWRGFLPVFVRDIFPDRADAMERAWAANAGWAPACAQDPLGRSLVDWQRDVKNGTRPATIFNSTLVESGDRLALSTAPIRNPYPGQVEFVTRQAGSAVGESLCPGADLHLVTAARLSATFPFVSPSARPGPVLSRVCPGRVLPEAAITEDQRKLWSLAPGRSGRLHVADGGYYDNSGLSALARWLDDGLTTLSTAPDKPWPKRILVIQLDGFPSDRKPSTQSQPTGSNANSVAKEHEVQKAGERGTFFQLIAPLETLYSVRGEAHTAYVNRDFAMLQTRWKLVPKKGTSGETPPRTTDIWLVKITMPLCPGEPDKRPWWFPAWAEAQPDEPPLSWHLRDLEKHEIAEGWRRIAKGWERNRGRNGEPRWKPPELDDLDWNSPNSTPLAKVLCFLNLEKDEYFVAAEASAEHRPEP